MTAIPKAPKGYWTCHWHAIYGNADPSSAYRPDSEEPVITKDKEKICHQCAETWRRERDKANATSD